MTKSVKFKPKFEISGLRKWRFKVGANYKSAKCQLGIKDTVIRHGIYFRTIKNRKDIYICLWEKDRDYFIFEVSSADLDGARRIWEPVFDDNFLDGDKEFG